jgi:hypothetical protein
VCRKLARAAAAATTSVELKASQRCDAFLSWTTSHGKSLTTLHLTTLDSSTRDLLCPNLLDLSLHGGHAQLCAGSEGVGLLHSCTALTKLSTANSLLLDSSEDVSALVVPAAVAKLQHLNLDLFLDEDFCQVLDGSAGGELAQAIEERLMPHLTALTHLTLDLNDVYSSKLRSCFLQHMQHIGAAPDRPR